MILFLCTELQKINDQNEQLLLSTSTPTKNKLDDGILVTHFSGWQNGTFKFFS